MGTQYLIDSNVVIDFLDNKITFSGMNFVSKIIDCVPNISVITQIEVLRYNAPKNAHLLLSDFIDNSKIFPLSEEIVPLVINICKFNKIKLPDAIIAATAVYYNLTLLTRNTDDFKNIENLTTINPYDI